MLSCDHLPFLIEDLNPIQTNKEPVSPTAMNDKSKAESLWELGRFIFETHSFGQLDSFFMLLNDLPFEGLLVVSGWRPMEVL